MSIPLKREGGRWIATGPLPNNVTLRERSDGQVFVSESGQLQPDCFGLCWEAVGPGPDSEECKPCDMEPLCRHAMVQVHLPTVLEQVGPALEAQTAEALAPELGVNHEAVNALLEDYRATHEPTTAASKTKRPKRPPRRRVLSETGAEGAPTENPMLAPGAQLVVAGASRSLMAKACAKIAEAWDAERRLWVRPWEAKLQRDREREASPWIARLVPGMILRRSFAGTWWTLTVCKYGYQFQGIKYPTLRAATTVLLKRAGHPRQQSGWDMVTPNEAARWWCLPRLLLPLPADRQQIKRMVDREVERLRNVFLRVG